MASNFIQKPMLNETQFLIEINAVNSEYDTYNDSLENTLNILRDNANPAHGFSQTVTGHTGSNVTLRSVSGSEMKEILKNYFLTIFKPENCIFLIYSSASFDDMAERAQKYFGFKLEEPTKEFQNQINSKITALDNPIFLEGQLGKIAIYSNLRETPMLYLTFVFSQNDKYAEIINLLYYFFNHYYEGSFQNYIKNKNYVGYFQYLTVGYYKNCEIAQFIFYLTSDGIKNIDKIIEALFASINVIKKETDANLEAILDNIKNIENKIYQFKEDRKATFPDDIDSMMRNFYFMGEKNIFGSPINELYTLKRLKQTLGELSPDKTFITIDTNEKISSKYLNPSSEMKFTRSYNVPYKMNNISEENISQLKQITSVDGYNFKKRKINDDFSKLENMTDIPCYKKVPNTCNEYNETDLNSKEDTQPYIINKTEKILSLMKIDRTFGIPLIKGYIEYELDIQKEQNQTAIYLIILSLYQKFSESSLYEAGSYIDFQIGGLNPYKIQIIFSTYNDVLDKVIDYILNLLKEPIDENTFNNLKQQYYVSIANNVDSPAVDYRSEMLNIFRRFITIDTYNFIDIPKEEVEDLSYDNFKETFKTLMDNINKLKYLTYGDISIELAASTTNKLNSIIKTKNLLFKLNDIKIPNVPYNSSIYYITKSTNKYQVQGRTLVLYEFNETLKKQMQIFAYCARNYLFDYIRTLRGSGYAVTTFYQKILDKSYLVIYVLGKVYSPEKMDRFVNEALKESFSYKNCKVDLILKHLKSKDNINGYIEDKFYNQLYYLEPESYFNNEKIDETEENTTFENIVEDLQEVFVNKVRRFAMLCHRGDESDEQYQKEVTELDEKYYFNDKITNDYTHEIDYLKKFLK